MQPLAFWSFIDVALEVVFTVRVVGNVTCYERALKAFILSPEVAPALSTKLLRLMETPIITLALVPFTRTVEDLCIARALGFNKPTPTVFPRFLVVSTATHLRVGTTPARKPSPQQW